MFGDMIWSDIDVDVDINIILYSYVTLLRTSDTDNLHSKQT